MRTALYVAIVLTVAAVFFFIGSNQKQSSQLRVAPETNAGLEQAVKDMPRGALDIPAQWFMMESLVGWEKMMLIFGYADNRDVCFNMVDMAREESPERNFRCEDAN